MKESAAQLRAGEEIPAAMSKGADIIKAAGFALDYFEIRNADTLAPVASASDGPLRILVASKIGQLAAHRFRHRGNRSGRGLAEIGRRGIGGKVSPPLERAHRPRRHGDHLRLHNKSAATDPVLVAERFDANDLLAGGDFATNHPIERATGEDFVNPLWRHPGDVDVTLRKTLFLCGLHALGDPALQLFDGIAANGELDQVKRHEVPSAGVRVGGRRISTTPPAPVKPESRTRNNQFVDAPDASKSVSRPTMRAPALAQVPRARAQSASAQPAASWPRPKLTPVVKQAATTLVSARRQPVGLDAVRSATPCRALAS